MHRMSVTIIPIFTTAFALVKAKGTDLFSGFVFDNFLFPNRRTSYRIFNKKPYFYQKHTYIVPDMIQEIIAYKSLMSSIEDRISASPYKKSYIIAKVGIPAPTFYRKLKTQSFTADEMLELAKILAPEEYYLLELKESIKRGKDDYKNGNFRKHEDVISELRKEFST